MKKVYKYFYKKIKYWFNYINKHIKELFKTIIYISRITGKSSLFIFIDIIRCFIKFGSSYNEYRIFKFFLIDDYIKDTYLTKIRHENLEKYLYKKNNLLKDRREFYKKFNKYLNRKVCYIKNLSFKQLENFILENDELVCKSNVLLEKNSKILYLKDFRSPAFVLSDVNKNNLYFLEENFKQHKLIEKINPYNINILSIVTLKYKNTVNIINSTIKFGSSVSFVYDYQKSNYINGYIDIANGKIKGKCIDRYGKTFSHHPISGESFIDFKVPNFKKAINTAIKCAKDIDNILEIEWNFAISKTKIILISANIWKDYIFCQMPEFLEDKKGLMPYYRMHIDKSKKIK